MTDALLTKNCLLFYPTSPVHVYNLSLIAEKLPDWNITCVISENSMRLSPGIAAALDRSRFENIVIERVDQLSELLPDDCTVVMLGASFEPFSLELFAWAKVRAIPVVAVEEVAQLSLNNCELNNYDLPLDLLFVANEWEYQLFRKSGWSEESLAISGLLSWGRFARRGRRNEIRERLGIGTEKQLLVYTTSPLRSRLTIHNKDDRQFRDSVLNVLMMPAVQDKWEIVVKLHPNENLATEKEVIRRVAPNVIVHGSEVDTLDLLEAADAVMNRGNSETILDAIILGRPVLIIACGIKTMFHDLGSALVLEKPEEVITALKEVESGSSPEFSKIEAVYAPPTCGVAEFIAGKLQGFAGKKLPLTTARLEWLVRSYLFLGMMDRIPAIFELWQQRTPLLAGIESAVTSHLASDFNGSISNWQAVSKLYPEWFYPHYELAHANLAIGNWAIALSHAEDAIRLHPPFHYLWHEIPMAIVKTTALRNMGMAVESMAEARSFDRKGVSEHMPELLIERAAISLQLGRQEDALDLVCKGLDVLGSHPLWPHIDSLFYHRAGLLLRDLGKTAHAMDCFDNAIHLAPRSFWPLYEKGLLLCEVGDFGEAADILLKIVANPAHLDLIQLNMIYEKLMHALRQERRFSEYVAIAIKRIIGRFDKKSHK
ncbi:hypothetical protein KI809_09530 [Geobacter pelophilus]|uniref:Tetratricopeptide repeat protein n=1 Tax=Geoanaerobacter pelophilus TaxID=60036 RepID=A0AAW4L682_9BACT|nr:hypothetical protein [Geoanaerobacter pelophilus]MBT0664538.1 hypothetical protein [Geoanaerobacter pelophilus]